MNNKKTVNPQEKRLIFDSVYGIINIIHEQFYVWDELKNHKKFGKARKANSYFWDTVYYSLEKGFFIDIATLFSIDPGVVSLYKLLNCFDIKKAQEVKNKIKKKKNIIEKIGKWRNTNFAHKDYTIINNPEDFESLFPLKYSEIKELLDFLREIFDDIEELYRGEKVKWVNDGVKKDIKDEVNNILNKD